jgi:hypothetical protein
VAQTFAQPSLSPPAGYIAAQASAAPGALATGLQASTVGSYPGGAQPYDSDYLARLIEMFEASEDQSRDNREKAERDVDYYDGKQWTETEIKKLSDRGQAAIANNLIRPKIRYLQGLEKSQRTDPVAKPRTPKHEEDASTATAVLRFTADDNRYDQARSKVFKDVASVGWGGNEVVVEHVPGQPNPKVIIRRCQWDRMFWDPYSSEDDFSDASYLGLVIWMDREEAQRRYGEDAGKVFDETVQTSQVGGTYDDRPKTTTWVDRQKRVRVRVVQIYHIGADGTWQFCEFTKGGFLNAGPSPWLDDFGRPEHPYCWASANVDRDNNRFGEIRELIDLQDSINKRESKFLHLVSVRQTFGTEGSLGSKTTRDLRNELAKPDGHVSLAPGIEFGKQFGVIPTGDMAQGQFELLQNAKADMQVHGPNAAMMGKGPSGASGRSILANQQGGSLEASPLTDALRDLDHRTYQKVWRRVRQFWVAEQWVSITDDMKNLKWTGVNQPVPDPMTGQPAVDPMTGQPVVQNELAKLVVDITIDDAPHVGTMQDEEFGKLADLAAVVPALQQLPADVWIGMSSLRNKGALIQKIQQQQGPPPDPIQEAANQVQIEEKQANTAHKAAQAEETRQRATGHAIENATKVAMLHAPMGNVVPMQPPGIGA